MSSHDCVIVGSGINALVCAAVLGKRGRRVCVLERNERFGGCIRSDELTVPGFTHDVLSSWYPLFTTSPGYEVLAGDLAARGIEFCNTDTPTAAVLPDDRYFIFNRARDQNVRAMNALAAGDGDRYAEAMAALARHLDLTFTLLGAELWTWPTARALLKAMLKMGPHGLAQFGGEVLQSCRRWLEHAFRSEAVAACLAPWPLHAGIAPDAALSGHMAKVICFALEAAGAPVVKGGSARIVAAFEDIIRANGGELRAGVDVERVLTEQGAAVGVCTADGREYRADKAVICSVTPGQLYTRLLDAGSVPEEIARQARAFRHGRADMQIHLALDAPPEWVDPGLARVAIVHLTGGVDDVAQAGAEADRGDLPAEPTIVVGQPSALDPSRCPPGKAILWLQLLEMPPVVKGDAAGEIAPPPDGRWTPEVRERYADRIVARVARHIRNLEGKVLGRAVLSPADLEAINVNLVGGDPYGGACTLDQYLLWRPLRGVRNHATPVARLFHIGASTHPGPGLGGGSGFLVANAL
jgi:phytoene dehydrogenase-like protein